MDLGMKEPGWYRVNNLNHFQYFDGKNLDTSSYHVINVSNQINFFIGPNKKPRTKSLRFLFILLGFFVLAINFFFIGLISSYDGAQVDSSSLESFARLVGLVIIGILCRQVGYRWFDAFFALIPFYGVYFIIMILWRASVLPHRYWKLRNENTEIREETALSSQHVALNENPSKIRIMNIPDDSQLNTLKNNAFYRIIHKFKTSKIAILVLILLLIIPSITFIAAKTNLYNDFRCKSLKTALSKQDEIGRSLWNSYQSEVSALANTTNYFAQKENVVRRVIQVLESDKIGYNLILEKPYCAQDIKEVNRRLDLVKWSISYLNNEVKDDNGTYFKDGFGWNREYYKVYYDFSSLLKN